MNNRIKQIADHLSIGIGGGGREGFIIIKVMQKIVNADLKLN